MNLICILGIGKWIFYFYALKSCTVCLVVKKCLNFCCYMFAVYIVVNNNPGEDKTRIKEAVYRIRRQGRRGLEVKIEQDWA